MLVRGLLQPCVAFSSFPRKVVECGLYVATDVSKSFLEGMRELLETAHGRNERAGACVQNQLSAGPSRIAPSCLCMFTSKWL